MKIGNKITARRKELGMTQQELADKLYVSVKTISKWETNRGNPEMSMLPQLAKALDIGISDLFDESESEEIHVEEKRTYDLVNAVVEFGIAFFGLVFYFLTFVTLPVEFGFSFNLLLSGYGVLFRMTGSSYAILLILGVWISFLAVLSHIAFGVIEIVVNQKDILLKKQKAAYIISIVELIAIAIALLISVISEIGTGFGLIMMLLLYGFALGYNIHYKKNHA